MPAFRFSRTALDVTALRQELADPTCGGYASFEGLVRNHNEGMSVRHLEYEAFEPLAIKEGERIVAEAVKRFGIAHAACVHRVGDLAIGEMAVWVGVSARHRDEAFRACRYIIDEVKHRVPIWKKEHYENGDSGWVNCERCATAPSENTAAAAGGAEHSHAHAHQHAHDHDHPHRHDHAHASASSISAREALAHAHPSGPGVSAREALAPTTPTPAPDYSRQIALKEVGERGQAKLRASRVLVVGCGGLGVPVIGYLAGAGVGRLGLVDSDRLEASNLHRQTMYALADVGKLKAELAAERVRALNPEVDVRVHSVRFQATNALELVSQYDLVIDCTDNFSTKFLLNDVCVQQRVPIIFSSVYQYEGQLQVVRPDREGPCLRCIWPEATRDGIVGNCAEAGVLGPVPGTFGSLQAFEALKLLLDLPGQLGQEILVLDLLTLSVSRVRAKRAANCPEHARLALARAQTAQVAKMAPEATPIEVSFDSLDDALAAGFEIVDVREPQELAQVPTPARRARHIPMAKLLHGDNEFARGAAPTAAAAGPTATASAPTTAAAGPTAGLGAQTAAASAPTAPAGAPTAKTLLVCASGRRSLAAAQELRSRGLSGVYSLRGGIAKLRQHASA